MPQTPNNSSNSAEDYSAGNSCGNVTNHNILADSQDKPPKYGDSHSGINTQTPIVLHTHSDTQFNSNSQGCANTHTLPHTPAAGTQTVDNVGHPPAKLNSNDKNCHVSSGSFARNNASNSSSNMTNLAPVTTMNSNVHSFANQRCGVRRLPNSLTNAPNSLTNAQSVADYYSNTNCHNECSSENSFIYTRTNTILRSPLTPNGNSSSLTFCNSSLNVAPSATDPSRTSQHDNVKSTITQSVHSPTLQNVSSPLLYSNDRRIISPGSNNNCVSQMRATNFAEFSEISNNPRFVSRTSENKPGLLYPVSGVDTSEYSRGITQTNFTSGLCFTSTANNTTDTLDTTYEDSLENGNIPGFCAPTYYNRIIPDSENCYVPDSTSRNLYIPCTSNANCNADSPNCNSYFPGSPNSNNSDMNNSGLLPSQDINNEDSFSSGIHNTTLIINNLCNSVRGSVRPPLPFPLNNSVNAIAKQQRAPAPQEFPRSTVHTNNSNVLNNSVSCRDKRIINVFNDNLQIQQQRTRDRISDGEQLYVNQQDMQLNRMQQTDQSNGHFTEMQNQNQLRSQQINSTQRYPMGDSNHELYNQQVHNQLVWQKRNNGSATEVSGELPLSSHHRKHSLPFVADSNTNIPVDQNVDGCSSNTFGDNEVTSVLAPGHIVRKPKQSSKPREFSLNRSISCDTSDTFVRLPLARKSPSRLLLKSRSLVEENYVDDDDRNVRGNLGVGYNHSNTNNADLSSPLLPSYSIFHEDNLTRHPDDVLSPGRTDRNFLRQHSFGNEQGRRPSCEDAFVSQNNPAVVRHNNKECDPTELRHSHDKNPVELQYSADKNPTECEFNNSLLESTVTTEDSGRSVERASVASNDSSLNDFLDSAGVNDTATGEYCSLIFRLRLFIFVYIVSRYLDFIFH